VSTSDTAGGAGVLHSLLQPLARHGINMTRIESRPSRRRKWDYVFFIDIEGHAEQAPVSDALADLESSASLFKVLGAYPKAIG
jgi:chorismate mutase/prephenate dehydratase